MDQTPVADPLQGCEPCAPKILQLRQDRRLGHEWDDWNGESIPQDGIYHEKSNLFFGLLVLWFGAVGLAGTLAAWLAGPRLGGIWSGFPLLLWGTLGGAALLFVLWLGALAAMLRTGRNILPPWLVERGLLPWTMPLAGRAGRWLGISRDRAGNAALRVYNGLVAARSRTGLRPDEILVLLPRCLDKAGMQGALDVSARYGVPLFVAARGRYAREMIGKIRPRAVVAVACERDLVSGVHDVAGHLPVLGTTIGLPEGPCKNTSIDISSLEAQLRLFLGFDAGAE